MTAAAVLADLRTRGVSVEAHGDRLRLVPADRVTNADREALRQLKADVLALLTQPDGGVPASDATLFATWHTLGPGDRSRLEDEMAAGDPLAKAVLTAVACNPHAVAWRLYSHRLDRELWVVRDDNARAHVTADGTFGGLPVVLAAELEELGRLDTATLAAVLDAKAAFGAGTRLASPGGAT